MSGGETVEVAVVPGQARCEMTCEHGSRCVLDAGHNGLRGHETEHGCICYEQPIAVEIQRHGPLQRDGEP